MSLFGALYAGVAGLDAQSNTLGIVSDDIANANTVGYKQGASAFETLVTASTASTAATAAYSPGGVISSTQQLVSQQGLLQTTSSPTDIAISGAGLFVVNSKATGAGQVEYTRAGSFTQDKTGNFVNSAGLYLQAWPLDRNGDLPGAPGNTNTQSSANVSSLQTVNVENLTGTAAATTSISLGANLNSTQTAYPGAAGNVTMDAQDTVNYGITAASLILPTGVDGLDNPVPPLPSTTAPTQQMVVTTGSGLSYTYTYGGVSGSRNVTDAAPASNAATSLTNPPFTTTNGSNTVTVNESTAGLVAGDTVTFAGISGSVNGIPASEMNGTFVINSIVDGSHYTITTPTTAATSSGTAGAGSITAQSRPFATTGTILDANTATQPFLGLSGTSGFSAAGLSFSITTAATGTVKFNYTSSSPNAALNQFNNLDNLATAINNVGGLTARVSNGQLFVGATDGTAAVTFANGSTTGTEGPPVQSGINWVGELGLSNISSQANRFSTMQGLSQLVNASAGLTGTITNPLSAASLKINVNDPLDTIDFSDGSGAGQTGSLLAELGLTPSLHGTPYTGPQTTGSQGPAYDPTDSTKNMASGAVAAQFSRPITVYDAQGTEHTLTAGYIKTAANTWAVEVYATPASDVSSTLSSGQVAYGTLTFNGDGSLRSVGSALAEPLNVNWTNGSSPSTMSIDWGTAGQPAGTTNASSIGKTDGMTQFDSDYNVSFVNQNGAPVGQLTGVSIDANGYVTASYNNGEVQKLYKIPLAQFNDADALGSTNGDSYTQTSASGEVNLRSAGDSGVGTISSGSVEQSNVDVATQLTNMIVAQQAYQANSKVISTVDTLLQALDQLIQ